MLSGQALLERSSLNSKSVHNVQHGLLVLPELQKEKQCGCLRRGDGGKASKTQGHESNSNNEICGKLRISGGKSAHSNDILTTRCAPTSTLVPGHTTQATYEVHRQTIWWKTFKKYLIEYAHSSIDHTIILDIRVIQHKTRRARSVLMDHRLTSLSLLHLLFNLPR